ncbi:MAG TPA: hypothetical protein VJB15_11795 [Rhodothermia bacterium]|nr:hypothetical protein [Rhodothermia bacterium]
MNTAVVKDLIAVIRTERDRRIPTLEDEHPDYAADRWLFTDEPFLNELGLVLLVAIRHQLEGELIRLAARVTDDRHEMSGDEYRQRIEDERERLRTDGWKFLIAKLRLQAFPEWNTSLKTLQLLANDYKHNPSHGPGEDLLKHLGLNPMISRSPTVRYAPLPESRHFREALALSLNLDSAADYSAIADGFLSRAERLLADVEQQLGLSPVKCGPVSLTEFVG